MSDDNTAEDLSCSFCGKGQDEVKQIIRRTLGACICDKCHSLCNDIALDRTLCKTEKEKMANRTTRLYGSGRKTRKKSVSSQRGVEVEWLEQLAARHVVVPPTAPSMLSKSVRLKGKGKLAAEMVLEDRR